MTDSDPRNMPPEVAEIAECGYAIWAGGDVEEVWEINLEALDGSKFEVDSRLLKAAR